MCVPMLKVNTESMTYQKPSQASLHRCKRRCRLPMSCICTIKAYSNGARDSSLSHIYYPFQHVMQLFISIFKTKVTEKSRECHNHKLQPFPYTKRKRKPTNPNKHKSNKCTKSTKTSPSSPSEATAMPKGPSVVFW